MYCSSRTVLSGIVVTLQINYEQARLVRIKVIPESGSAASLLESVANTNAICAEIAELPNSNNGSCTVLSEPTVSWSICTCRAKDVLDVAESILGG